METHATMTQIFQLANELPPSEKFELVKLIISDIQNVIDMPDNGKSPLQSAYGICTDIQPVPSEEDIAHMRQEVFSSC